VTPPQAVAARTRPVILTGGCSSRAGLIQRGAAGELIASSCMMMKLAKLAADPRGVIQPKGLGASARIVELTGAEALRTSHVARPEASTPPVRRGGGGRFVAAACVAGAEESGAHVADVAANAEAPRRRAIVQRAVVLVGAALGVPVRIRRGGGWALTGRRSQPGSVAGGGLIWRFLWTRSRARPDVAAPQGVRRRGTGFVVAARSTLSTA
jgi:hypothetical protein